MEVGTEEFGDEVSSLALVAEYTKNISRSPTCLRVGR